MGNLPPVLVELWEAASAIIEKLARPISKALIFLGSAAVFLFEKFVELMKWIADKL